MTNDVMTDQECEDLIVKVMVHFIESEGTDYLNGEKGEPLPYYDISGLSDDERTILGRCRDIARHKTGWAGWETL